MSFKASRLYGIGFATLAVAAIAACSSSDSNNGNTTAGAAGAGTAGAGTAGHAGTGTAGAGTAGAGTAGAGTAGAGTAGAGGTTACAAATGSLITSFADTVAATDTGNPGGLTFMAGIPGGTFTYQSPAVFTLSQPPASALEVKGTVNGYDGFGLYFNACTDASAYTGVSFNIKGNVGASGMLSFRFHNLADEPVANNGTCVVSGTDTYASCHFASFPITVTPGGSVVAVKFTDVTGGLPITTVDGKDLVGLEWAFTWTPPAAGTAGAGGATAGAGGATAGAGGATAGAGGATAGAGGATAGAGGATAGAGGATAGAGGSGGAVVAGSYPVDVTVDDIMFTGGPAGGGAGGAGGTSGTAGAGGATAGAGGAAAGAGGAAAGAGGAAAGAGGTAGHAGSAGTGGTAGHGGA